MSVCVNSRQNWRVCGGGQLLVLRVLRFVALTSNSDSRSLFVCKVAQGIIGSGQIGE